MTAETIFNHSILHNQNQPAHSRRTVLIDPYESPGYTHQLILSLVRGEAEVDPGFWGSPIGVEFETETLAAEFIKMCRDARWVVWLGCEQKPKRTVV